MVERKHVRGDLRADGKVFESYRKVNGRTYERWVTPEQLEKRRQVVLDYSKKWQKDNRHKTKEYTRKSNLKRRQEDPLRFMLVAAKARAKKAGLEFSISRDDLSLPVSCPILKHPLSVGIGHMHDWSPSIDRINPLLGYVKGNVVIISYRANRIKNCATLDELKRLVNFYSRLMKRSP